MKNYKYKYIRNNFISSMLFVIIMFISILKLYTQEDSVMGLDKKYPYFNTLTKQQLNVSNENIKDTAQNISVHKYSNIIEINFPYTYIKVPYIGFLRRNEFFNLTLTSIQINYSRNLSKNSNWFWGMLVAYEWYKIRFYADDDRKHPKTDTSWFKNKYKNDLYVIDIVNSNQNLDFYFSNLKDSMLKYYGGEKLYPFRMIRIGYSLSYHKKLSNSLTLRLMVESSASTSIGTCPCKDRIQIINSGVGAYFPLYPLVNIFEKITGEVANGSIMNGGGMVKYIVSLKHDFYKRHSLLFTFAWANMFAINYKGIYPEYDTGSNNSNNCLGCSPNPYPIGQIIIKVAPNFYRRIQLSINYSINF